MLPIFLKGGPVMWPLLAISLVALSVIVERILFTVRTQLRRDRSVVERMFREVERGSVDEAALLGASSRDFLARTLGRALAHHDVSFSNGLLQAAGAELRRFNRGISVLDTVVTLAPLLGLFGTVTGMIRAFGLLGASELGAPAQITGGIAEALIATAFGLLIAMVALVPFNYLTARLEQARQEIETSAAYLELLLLKAAGKGDQKSAHGS